MKKTTSRVVEKGETDWQAAWPNTSVLVGKHLQAEAKAEYVGWIDLMGAKSWMAGSIRHAAELIGLIHLAGLSSANEQGAKAYPVIDGVYITSPEKTAFRKATRQTMRILAQTFESRPDNDRFLVRGGIAYGRVLHGESIAKLHPTLQADTQYAHCLAIGASIRLAYEAETKAPPFGFYVDMTARSVAPGEDSPYVSAFDRWWSLQHTKQEMIAKRFGAVLDGHFASLKLKHREIEYPLDRLEAHRAAAAEYFRHTDLNRDGKL